jgi:Rod binding domain-containing protein
MKIGSIDMMQSQLNNNSDIQNIKNLSESVKKKGAVVDKEKKAQEADNVAKEFETLFVDMMLKSMRQTAKAEDESNAQDIYKGMLDSEYSKSMTEAQSFGIRQMIKEWITQNS